MSKPIKATLATAAIVLGFGVTGASQATNTSIPQMYSATTVYAMPGKPEQTGKIVKSGPNMRLEFQQNGQDIVQILRPTLGVMYFLDPQRKQYTETHGPVTPPQTINGYTSPCPTPAAATHCRMIGQAISNGLQTERWMIDTVRGSVIILWDPTRRHALRADYPDGGNMVMTYKATEDLGGRATEHWNLTISRPGQKAVAGDWWFDPKLRIVVRETRPNGETRRLENIKVSTFDVTQFTVPKGWKRYVPPAAPAGPASTTPGSAAATALPTQQAPDAQATQTGANQTEAGKTGAE